MNDRTTVGEWLAEVAITGLILSLAVAVIASIAGYGPAQAITFGLGVALSVVAIVSLRRLWSHAPTAPQQAPDVDALAQTVFELTMQRLPEHARLEITAPRAYYVQTNTDDHIDHTATVLAETLQAQMEAGRKRRWLLLASLHDFLVAGQYVGYARSVWCPTNGARRHCPTAGVVMSQGRWGKIVKNLQEHHWAEVSSAGVKLNAPVHEVLAAYGLQANGTLGRQALTFLDKPPRAGHIRALLE